MQFFKKEINLVFCGGLLDVLSINYNQQLADCINRDELSVLKYTVWILVLTFSQVIVAQLMTGTLDIITSYRYNGKSTPRQTGRINVFRLLLVCKQRCSIKKLQPWSKETTSARSKFVTSKYLFLFIVLFLYLKWIKIIL